MICATLWQFPEIFEDDLESELMVNNPASEASDYL